jgi:hypothetical protein
MNLASLSSCPAFAFCPVAAFALGEIRAAPEHLEKDYTCAGRLL